MFFQFSPIHAEKKPKPPVKENEAEKIETLILAPFKHLPKLFFEDIKVGETATQKLLVKNPTDKVISISVNTNIPNELNVTFNWEQTILDGGSESLFEVTWCPQTQESTRHIITFEDFKKIRRDVPVAFKSVAPKKSKTGAKQRNTQSKNVQKPRLLLNKMPTKKISIKSPNISPNKCSPSFKRTSPLSAKYSPLHKKKSPIIKKSVSPSLPQIQKQCYIESPKRSNDYAIKGKENLPHIMLNESNDSNIFISPKNASFLLDSIKPIERRVTYVLDAKIEKSPSISFTTRRETYVLGKTTIPATVTFNDSLEEITSPGVSPLAAERSFSTIKNSTQIYQQRQPLGLYNGDNISPDIQKNPNELQGPLSYDFEHKLMRLQSFCFSPVLTPSKQTKDPTYLPSTVEKVKNHTPLSLHVEKPKGSDTLQIPNGFELFPQNSTFELPSSNILNISSETYVKSNVSGETYVKENTSFETYIKGNLSGGTYTKDSSVGNMESLNLSPLSSKSTISPRMRLSTTSYSSDDNSQDTTDWWSRIDRKQLSSIQEESYMYNSARESISSMTSKSRLKRKLDVDLTFVPLKRPNISNGPKDWSKKGGSAFRIAKQTSGLNLKQFADQKNIQEGKEMVAKLTKSDTNKVIIQNPFILAATNLVDPFMTPNLYVNQEWIDQQEIDFKKWLNALLTPPEELASVEQVVDVAKVWQESKKREVDVAPTKEIVSNKYHTSSRLNTLRKAAQDLFRSKEISTVLSKVFLAIDQGKLSIREDKDVNLNLSIKSEIISLLLSYNPLWLRIGLETVYNEVIPLHSNSDVFGLSTFIVNRVLKDPYLIKKHKSIHAPKYTPEFNKFFLKKFFTLVYFLDQAKNKKLISHDPCLFCKKGSVKESRELLLGLARETLSAVGDITKFLKFSGYVVTHVQTYIHEFDYAVKNLGVDLRDGVRLTKVMEIILMKDNLTSSLRVPAISRLQKVYNMKIVFDSLEKAGYKILYDISHKDIVDGHKEKTLSFLWQIIYKFEAPLMVKNATTIQTWFRSLPVVLKRRVIERNRLQRENAAIKIQQWYKSKKFIDKLTKFTTLLRRYMEIKKMERAAIKIQAYYKMFYCRRKYVKQIQTITVIQSRCKGWLVRNVYRQRIQSTIILQSYVRMFIAKQSYLKLKNAAIIIQTRYRAKKNMEIARIEYTRLKWAVTLIQTKFRNNRLAVKGKQTYQELKSATVKLQQRFRANKLCKIEQQQFIKVRSATLDIQKWYRSVKAIRRCRKEYLTLKKSVRIIEEHYISLKLMKSEQHYYSALKFTTITIQQRYRAIREMRLQRSNYLQVRTSAILLQRKYRAKKLMESSKYYYNNLKLVTTLLQKRIRANVAMRKQRKKFIVLKMSVVKIQNWFRATLEMKKCRNYYVSLKSAVQIIERKYEAKRLMEKESNIYQEKRSATIIIQRKYRAFVAMRICRQEYVTLKFACILIQNKFRAQRISKIQRLKFLRTRQAVLTIQNRFRAQRNMQKCRQDFIKLKMSTKVIQSRFRANILMNEARKSYLKIHKSVTILQRHYRAHIAMLKQREIYTNMKKAAITVQQRWRAIILGKAQKKHYDNLKRNTIFIQNKWRANKLAIQEKNKYIALKKAAIVLQRRWRAKRLCEETKNYYTLLKKVVTVVQQRWRANELCYQEKHHYESLKKSVLFVQRRWKANKLMREENNKYQMIKKASSILQRRWRAVKLGKQTRTEFNDLKKATLIIQRRWRAHIVGKKEKKSYEDLKKAYLFIQRKWRANKLAEQDRSRYQTLKNSSLVIQRRWRANRLSKKVLYCFISLKKATIILQQRWRAKKLCQIEKQNYISLRTAVVCVQIKYRAKKLQEKDRKMFECSRKAAIIIQQRWRAIHLCKIETSYYQKLRNATIFLQRKWRANNIASVERRKYNILKKSTLTIQKHWRATLFARKQRFHYCQLKMSAILIQRKWIAKKLCQTYRIKYTSLREAVIFIQQTWRAKKLGIKQRRRFNEIKDAVLSIQLRWKALKITVDIRNKYITLKHTVLFIQQKWRAKQSMKMELEKYTAIRKATIIIQKRFRANIIMKKERYWYISVKTSSIIIQNYYRGYLKMKQERTYYLFQKTVILNLQRFIRGYLVRHKYAYYFTIEAREQRKIQKEQRKAVVKIQASWKGYRFRCIENPAYEKIRQRLKEANKNAIPEKTLEWRSRVALEAFINEKSTLFNIIKALEELDLTTRHSKEICKTMGKLLPAQLYVLFSATSRSLPEMNACIFSVNILITFCKYPPTKQYSFMPQYIDSLITLMLHWCDKESLLFPTTCTLLWLFAHNLKWKQFILSLPHFNQRFEKIHTLVSRKESMVRRTGTKGVFSIYKDLPTPSLKPDWGLSYNVKPNTFCNSVHAFSTLSSILKS